MHPAGKQEQDPLDFHIVDLVSLNATQQQQAAALLVTCFAEHWPDAWPDMAAAGAELQQALAEGRIGRAALAADGAVLGWTGGICNYDGLVWELHPLAVRPDSQRQGLGRALVADLAEQVRRRGGITITLGTDDEDNMTSLGGVDLFPDPLQHLARIRNLRGHPYEFYLKCGFALTGVVPDANGPGKPDILMARRVAGR